MSWDKFVNIGTNFILTFFSSNDILNSEIKIPIKKKPASKRIAY